MAVLNLARTNVNFKAIRYMDCSGMEPGEANYLMLCIKEAIPKGAKFYFPDDCACCAWNKVYPTNTPTPTAKTIRPTRFLDAVSYSSKLYDKTILKVKTSGNTLLKDIAGKEVLDSLNKKGYQYLIDTFCEPKNK